jgi:phage gpG-like protein
MPEITVKVDASRATLSLRQFSLSLGNRSELMQAIGAGQLLSVYKTFDEQGPGWPPLSPASLSWNKKYTAAHKLLQNTGLGRSSIRVASDANSAVIGTNLFYMQIQQEGFTGTQNVGAYDYVRRAASRDQFQKRGIVNKLGRRQTVNRKVLSGIAAVHVRAFSRSISIPPRPFLVFRPEDPARIAGQVRAFVVECARRSGLEAQ